jgi:hypothetical protein
MLLLLMSQQSYFEATPSPCSCAFLSTDCFACLPSALHSIGLSFGHVLNSQPGGHPFVCVPEWLCFLIIPQLGRWLEF